MGEVINLSDRRPYRSPPEDVVVGIRNGMVVVRRPNGLLALKDAELVKMEQTMAGERPCDTGDDV